MTTVSTPQPHPTRPWSPKFTANTSKPARSIIQTNTFGANRYKLARHGLEDKVAEINRAGVELARRVVLASFKDVLIAGDVGPLGVRLAPFGRVQPEQARAAFAEQIGALAEAGVDLLIIETMTDLYEIVEAIQAAREVAPHLPVVASMTFTRDDRTLLGDSPAKVARDIHEAGADVIGVNCSGGPNQLLRILKQMRQAVPEGHFSVMPNAGWPEQVGGRIMYPAAPEYFGEYALSFWEAGASLIGGCCGTTPAAHRSHGPGHSDRRPRRHPAARACSSSARREESAPAEQPTQLAQKLAAGQFVVAVEMDPPRGLSTHKLLAGASLLAEAGADVIDVADSPMARMRMSPWAVCSSDPAQGRRRNRAALPHPRAQPAARAGRPAGRPRPGCAQCLRGHGRPHRHRRLPRCHGQLRPGPFRPDQADQAGLQRRASTMPAPISASPPASSSAAP